MFRAVWTFHPSWVCFFLWFSLGGVDLLLTTAWPSGLDQKLEDGDRKMEGDTSPDDWGHRIDLGKLF